MQRISRDHIIHTYDKSIPPVATVQPGEAFVIETIPSSVNATGPVAVWGAEPGDALAIAIHDIGFWGQATMWMKPRRGFFGEYLSDHLRDTVVRPIPLQDGKAIFSDSIAIPIRPMIGVVGVVPYGDPLATFWPGRHGGNLDCTLVKPGNTLYLPVAVPGALLALGDLHAAMGDGEIMLTGVEVGGEVALTIEVVKSWPFTGPWVETPGEFVALGSARDMDAALGIALRQMMTLLQSQAGLTFEEAGMLCSAAADCTICQVVNPQVTMRVSLPKGLVTGLHLR